MMLDLIWRKAFLHVWQKSVFHKMIEAIKQLKQFLLLEENWDSYDAAPVASQSVRKAIQFIEKMDVRGLSPDFVSPGPNGEVMILLRHADLEAECIFYPDRSVFVIFKGKAPVSQQALSPKQYDTFLNEWVADGKG